MVSLRTAFGNCICKYGDDLSTRDSQEALPGEGKAPQKTNKNDEGPPTPTSTTRRSIGAASGNGPCAANGAQPADNTSGR